jgi:hypothetical protein
LQFSGNCIDEREMGPSGYFDGPTAIATAARAGLEDRPPDQETT